MIILSTRTIMEIKRRYVKMDAQEYFVRIPVSVLMNNKLTRSSILLYAILVDYANQWGIIEATIEQLSKRSGLSPATIRRAEKQLVETNLLDVSRTGRASVLRLTEEGIRIQNYSAVEQYKKAVKHG